MRLSSQLIPWDAVRWKIPAASSLLTEGKVAHFENDTASKNSPRIKLPYPYLMNLVSIYLEKNILILQK